MASAASGAPAAINTPRCPVSGTRRTDSSSFANFWNEGSACTRATNTAMRGQRSASMA
jgi:hypothetical protein